jgi:antitoxin YefM
MRLTNFTDLRRNLKDYLDAVVNDSDTIIVNRQGNKGVVILSLDEYNAIRETACAAAAPESNDVIPKTRTS